MEEGGGGVRASALPYMEAEEEESVVLGGMERARRKTNEELQGDKLMTLLRSWEEAQALRSRAHSAPAASSEHSTEDIEHKGAYPMSDSRCEREKEEEEEEELHRILTAWEVNLTQIEDEMSTIVEECDWNGKESGDVANPRTTESENVDCIQDSPVPSVRKGEGSNDTQEAREELTHTEAEGRAQWKKADRSGKEGRDGQQLRAGMKMLLQRTQVARELVHSEEGYVEFLSQGLIAGYLQPLKQAITSGGKREEFGIDEADIKTMFSSIKIILSFHRDMLAEFRAKMETWSFCQTIGDVFLTNTDFMKVPYIDYTNNYTTALTTLEDKCRNTKLASFLEECREKNNIKAIESLLIMPIQRVPRYELLLKQLIKYTPSWHMDYVNLNESLVRIQEIVEKIDQRRMECDRVHDLVFVSRQLYPKVEDLVSPHRRLIRQGTFQEVPLDSNKASSLFGLRSLHLFLFNDVLLITERNLLNEPLNFFGGQRRFKVHRVLPLHNSVILSGRNKKRKPKAPSGKAKENSQKSKGSSTDSARSDSVLSAAENDLGGSEKNLLSSIRPSFNLNFIATATASAERSQELLWKQVFKIYSPNGKIQLLAPTQEAKRDWVNDLSRLVQQQTEHHRSFLSTSSPSGSEIEPLTSEDSLRDFVLLPSSPPTSPRSISADRIGDYLKENESGDTATSPQPKRVYHWARAYPQSFHAAEPVPSGSTSGPADVTESPDSSPATKSSAKDSKKGSLSLSTSLRNLVGRQKSLSSSSIASELDENSISISQLTSPRSGSGSSFTTSSMTQSQNRSYFQSFLSPPPDDRRRNRKTFDLSLRPWNREPKLRPEWKEDYEEADADGMEVRGVSMRRQSGGAEGVVVEKPQAIANYRRRPEWVPDEFLPYCANCGVQFTLTVRRHHCRQCGNIFCSSCASEERTLSHFGYQTPVRVCDVCVRHLDQWEHRMDERRRKGDGRSHLTSSAELPSSSNASHDAINPNEAPTSSWFAVKSRLWRRTEARVDSKTNAPQSPTTQPASPVQLPRVEVTEDFQNPSKVKAQ